MGSRAGLATDINWVGRQVKSAAGEIEQTQGEAKSLALPGRPQDASPGRTTVYLSAVAGVWFLYVLGYCALFYGGLTTALGIFTTVVEVSFSLTAGVAAVWFSRSHQGIIRISFILLAIASFGLAITDLVWGILFNVLGDTAPSGYVDLAFRIPFVVTTLCWLAFWCLTLVRNSNRNLSAQGVLVIGGISVLGVAVFIAAYLPLLSVETPDYVHIFVLIYASLELVALIVCVCAAILKSWEFPALLAAGFVLLISTDFLFNTAELTGQLTPNKWAEIPWALAEACIVAGVFAFHRQNRDAGSASRAADVYANNMMAVMIFSAVFASAVLSTVLLTDTIEIRVFALFLIVGLVVILVNRLSLLHGEAVYSAVGEGALLGGPGGKIRHEILLRVLGSYESVAAIRGQLLDVRSTAIRIGRGFTFRTSDTWQSESERNVFVIMPYGKEWSDDVFDVLRGAASTSHWTVRRGDQRFSHHDLLLNIWAELCQSEIAIADISAHAPNVLYEIGLAHAIGKPVVLLAQVGQAIPFDLAVQRTVFYDPSTGGWKEVLEKAVTRILDALDEERGRPSRRCSPALAADKRSSSLGSATPTG